MYDEWNWHSDGDEQLVITINRNELQNALMTVITYNHDAP